MMAVVESRVLHSRTLKKQIKNDGDFPGGPVVTTLYCQCKVCSFDPLLGNNSTCCVAKKKKIFIKEMSYVN